MKLFSRRFLAMSSNKASHRLTQTIYLAVIKQCSSEEITLFIINNSYII